MIKYIRKIDLQGNEVLQETVICNKCRKPLEPREYMYKLELTAAHPVRIEPGCAYGSYNSKPWHFCEECYTDVCHVLDGDVSPRKTAHWTGLQLEDYAELPDTKTKLAVTLRCETLKHIRHCSNCNTRFDARKIQNWKCCPVCESVIEVEKKADMFISIHRP